MGKVLQVKIAKNPSQVPNGSNNEKENPKKE